MDVDLDSPLPSPGRVVQHISDSIAAEKSKQSTGKGKGRFVEPIQMRSGTASSGSSQSPNPSKKSLAQTYAVCIH